MTTRNLFEDLATLAALYAAKRLTQWAIAKSEYRQTVRDLEHMLRLSAPRST